MLSDDLAVICFGERYTFCEKQNYPTELAFFRSKSESDLKPV